MTKNTDPELVVILSGKSDEEVKAEIQAALARRRRRTNPLTGEVTPHEHVYRCQDCGEIAHDEDERVVAQMKVTVGGELVSDSIWVDGRLVGRSLVDLGLQ